MRAILLAIVLLVGATLSHAAEYPTRPVRMIVPFPAGGGVDLITRFTTDILAQALGQPFIVDNRPGAGANLGADLLAKSAPDGYTIGTMTIGTHGINPTLYAHLPFDPVKDFTPITMLVIQPNVMVVPKSLGVRSVTEFIALAKAKPGALNAGSSGNGTSLHMSAEMFKQMTGVDIVHIPYRGAGPLMPDLLGGQVQVAFNNLPTVMPHIRSGALVPLGVTTLTRWPLLPELPTLHESGVPGFDVSSWYALMGPAKLPRDIVMALNQALVQGLERPDIRDRLLEMGTRPTPGAPEVLAAFVDSEMARWAPVVKATGLKID
ncbi:MAG: tripartite tricarboxylate transporter substrate binding protein [Proteobacteria bacterium]|nr:tripartite tricarboxylate transporter substrate binding protein [Pseudomonadota bacterium]